MDKFELFTDWVTYLWSKDIYLLWGQRFLNISSVVCTVLEVGFTTAAAVPNSERPFASEITRGPFASKLWEPLRSRLEIKGH